VVNYDERSGENKKEEKGRKKQTPRVDRLLEKDGGDPA
jgi:hypothetical protein